MNLKDVLIVFLGQTSVPCKAHEIAEEIGIDINDINRVLYEEQNKIFQVNQEYEWSLLDRNAYQARN